MDVPCMVCDRTMDACHSNTFELQSWYLYIIKILHTKWESTDRRTLHGVWSDHGCMSFKHFWISCIVYTDLGTLFILEKKQSVEYSSISSTYLAWCVIGPWMRGLWGGPPCWRAASPYPPPLQTYRHKFKYCLYIHIIHVIYAYNADRRKQTQSTHMFLHTQIQTYIQILCLCTLRVERYRHKCLPVCMLGNVSAHLCVLRHTL
jgi:hypothetical protein